MDRRKALRNIGWGAGALVATPTILNILQSCKEAGPVFSPAFVSAGQGHALRSMVDLIIPNDEQIPGAVAMGVHEFIDSYWNQVLAADPNAVKDDFMESSPTQEQQFVKDALAAYEAQFKATFNKELADGTPEEFDQLLAKYLKADKEQQEAYGKKMGEYLMASKQDPNATFDADAQVFYLLSSIRGLTIWGWKTSEEIGKNVLWYDPVPGQYKGCIPLTDTGNGKAMSL
ncbi:MAG TPA: gluconate 2-dehydrogenase subunit 3 family protein [Flavobacteriaceae bacterium]|nr:gluconate 2-dehydrogenase subunit 3 family protein [Flavobacteriaceae bacterium]MCB9212114.1 gluconate 2-dehydrogenase subunit 3 family protein [Alteromonas sp.]HPF10506.1 gluconate 2-dehydrogenase subunit 3 family protein [Flavobacteriaceae bacterium]HQU22097.1 gluconate 2-dehydrogenase subunit 3 family protein [Flavobacteriaceae bacterium]HQU66090.1 gluconate 2-dehydrogenase subunit 3 family protein [Flavobacteriaceae bacterium]